MFSLSLKQYIHAFILVEYIKIKVTENEKNPQKCQKWSDLNTHISGSEMLNFIHWICNILEFACQYEINKPWNKDRKSKSVVPNWQTKQRRTQTKK